jgi:hypothetical protein
VDVIARLGACETISNRIRSVPCPQGNWQGIFADPPLSGSPRPVLCNRRKDLRQIPCVEWAGNQAGYPVRIAGDFFGWQGFSKPRGNSSHAPLTGNDKLRWQSPQLGAPMRGDPRGRPSECSHKGDHNAPTRPYDVTTKEMVSLPLGRGNSVFCPGATPSARSTPNE